MKNTKKLLVGVLSVSALIGTGVAAWSIGGGVAKSTHELSTVTEEIIGNRDITLNVTKDPSDGIRFDSDADLKVTYKVKAERTEDNKDVNFDPYDLSNYENIAKDYKPNLKISTKVFDVVNGEKVELKEDAEFFKYVELPKVEPIDYTVWLGEEAKANDGYEVDLEFTWGSEINHENPQIYADKNNVGKTEEEQTAFFQNIISILDDVSFEFTFEVNGREGEVNPPEKETTGEITIPEVANSTLTIEGFDETTGTVEAGEHLITIETEAGKTLKDNKLTITEGSIEKTITLVETTALSRAGGHIYTATYSFLAERVYTFAYEVIDEPTPVVTHKVTFSVTPEEGGSVEVTVGGEAITSGDEVEEGKTAVVTIKNNEGYHLSSITVNKEVQEVSNSTLNIKVDGAKDIVVTFEKDETPDPVEYNKLADVVKMEAGQTFTSRGYYMGHSLLNSYGNYSAFYVADGEVGYMLFRVNPSNFTDINFDELVPGETILEFSGTTKIYYDLPEGENIRDLKVVEDETIEKPVTLEINPENYSYSPLKTDINRKVHIENALVTSINVNTKDTTIEFTVGESEIYKLYLKADDNDLSVVNTLNVGDTFSTNTWLGYSFEKFEFTYIEDFKIESVNTELKQVELKSDKTQIKIGDVANLTYETIPADFDEKPTFTSSDDTIATVDDNGVVTGKTVGKVTITVEFSNGVKDSIEIDVVGEVPVVESVKYTYNPQFSDEKDKDYFGKIAGNIYTSAMSSNNALDTINDTSEPLSENLITSVSVSGSVNRTTKENCGGIKFGTTSKTGEIILTLSKPVKSLTINFIAWNKDSASFYVNEEAQTCKAEYNDGQQVETFTVNFAEEGITTVKIASIAKRFVITGLEFFLA